MQQTTLLIDFALFAVSVTAAYRLGRRVSAHDADTPAAACPAADELLQLKARAIDESSNGIMIVSMTGGRRSVVFVNPAFAAMTGYAASEVVGAAPGRLHRQDKDQAGLHELRRALAEERAVSVVLRNYRKDGRLFWNKLAVSPVRDGSGRLTHYLGVLNDVTAQKLAEHELESSSRRLAALGTLSNDGMLTVDRNGRVSYANDALRRMFGLAEAEIAGMALRVLDQRIAALCNPRFSYRSIESDAARLAVDEACANRPTEIQLLRPQKRVLLRTTRQGNEETQFLLYFRDITQAREIEEVKSEFLATAAHELRTPMSSILGFSELLLQRNFDAESSREPLEIISRQSRRVTELLNELLDLARIEARRGKDFKLGLHHVRDIVHDVVAALPGPTQRVAVDIGADLPLVKADAQKIHQALSNLVANALKFSPPNETIEIAARVSADASQLGIAVTDRGIGMSEAQLTRCGERFWRADPSGSVPGTGLGVSLVKEIAELHGGWLQVCSEYGTGSCMTVWLPIAPPCAPGDSPAETKTGSGGVDAPG